MRYFVYMANREDEPGYVKIGYSGNPIRRMGELSGTSSVFPFQHWHAWEFPDEATARSAEKLIHSYLGIHRIVDTKEFFTVFDKYPHLRDDENLGELAPIHIYNQLNADICHLLSSHQVTWKPAYHNDLTSYYFQTHGKVVY